MTSINQLNKILLEDKRIIVRGDLDVPVALGEVVDGARLEAMRETLDYLTLRGAKVILMGHLGRPGGRPSLEYSMGPVANYLKNLKYSVKKADSLFGQEVNTAIDLMEAGNILLLENLRFDPGEESNDPDFARKLAALGDLYVNECFSTVHRAHASIVGIPKLIPAYTGLRLEKEIENLKKVLEDPEKPLVAILGGAKIETKLPVISRFLDLADYILLGGTIGSSYEGDNNYKILGPVDYTGDKQQDIGPKTINMFENVIKIAKTIIWNGPMGKIEEAEFMAGTAAIAKAVAASEAFSVVGGGDTVEALNKLKIADRMGFVSSGGGAMLEFISGKRLPGLEVLNYYA